MSFLSGVRGASDAGFDDYDAFVPERIPEPGQFLAGHDVLTGRDHAAFHRFACMVFEERGVYDMTFGYNLARLNFDQRHPEAGFRYAEEQESGDRAVLRAEFTPTTEFCPQSDTLTIGSFRAFNGERDRHGYDLVKVRVDDVHHQSASINDKLQRLEETFVETGNLRPDVTTEDSSRDDDPSSGVDAPF